VRGVVDVLKNVKTCPASILLPKKIHAHDNCPKKENKIKFTHVQGAEKKSMLRGGKNNMHTHLLRGKIPVHERVKQHSNLFKPINSHPPAIQKSNASPFIGNGNYEVKFIGL